MFCLSQNNEENIILKSICYCWFHVLYVQDYYPVEWLVSNLVPIASSIVQRFTDWCKMPMKDSEIDMYYYVFAFDMIIEQNQSKFKHTSWSFNPKILKKRELWKLTGISHFTLWLESESNQLVEWFKIWKFHVNPSSCN